MRFLVIGLGSMGKRRIRNLQYLKAGEILAFDPRLDRCAEAAEQYGVRVFPEFDDAMGSDPDTVLICTPPEHHLHYSHFAVQNRKHFFSEVGVGTKGIAELIRVTEGQGLVAAPSCTLRFNPLVRRIKDLVDAGEIGPILTFSSHSGQYLPDWHPWEDYRSFWASNRETGACREQFVLEAIWLTWVLGPIRSVMCSKGKVTTLDTNIDDVYHVLVRIGSAMLGNLVLDAVSRVPYRTGRLFSEEGIIEWDLIEKRVRVFSAPKGGWREYTEQEGQAEAGYLHAEHMYISEMEHFVKAVSGEQKWVYSLDDDLLIQEALEAADRSAETCEQIQLTSKGGVWAPSKDKPS